MQASSRSSAPPSVSSALNSHPVYYCQTCGASDTTGVLADLIRKSEEASFSLLRVNQQNQGLLDTLYRQNLEHEHLRREASRLWEVNAELMKDKGDTDKEFKAWRKYLRDVLESSRFQQNATWDDLKSITSLMMTATGGPEEGDLEIQLAHAQQQLVQLSLDNKQKESQLWHLQQLHNLPFDETVPDQDKVQRSEEPNEVAGLGLKAIADHDGPSGE